MGGPHTKTRRHGKVDNLPEELQAEVDRLLIEGDTYEDISAFLKKKGHDISKSSIGRYGKPFLNEYRNLRIIEDKSRALVSEAGGDSLILEEAGTKLFAQKIIEFLLEQKVDMKKIPDLVFSFASLQRSSVAREKLKAEFRKKADKAVKEIEKKTKKQLSPDTLKYIKEVVYGLAS